MGNFIIDDIQKEKILKEEQKLLKILKDERSSIYNSCRGFRFVHAPNERGILELQVEEVVEEDKWKTIQESDKWRKLQENISNQENKVAELEKSIDEEKRQKLIDFLTIQNDKVRAENFLKSIKSYTLYKILYYDEYPNPIRKFEKLRLIDAIKWCYENWFAEILPVEVDGTAKSCYSTYILTHFDTTFEGHEVISKIYLDMSYSPKEDLHGGLYCEGQQYIHLNRKELLKIKECMCCIEKEECSSRS